MKKKTIKCATAFGVLVASVPVYAIPAEVKAEIAKTTDVSELVDGVPSHLVVPEDEWKKFETIADIEASWEHEIETKDDGTQVVVLTKYIGATDNPKVEIPREIDGMKVELSSINKNNFPNVTHIRVAEGDENNKVKLRASSLHEAFAYNYTLKYADLRGLDTESLTTASRIFWGAGAIQYVNLSGWDVSNVKTFQQIFYDAPLLKHANLSGWDIKSDANTGWFLNGQTRLAGLVLKDITIDTYNKIKSTIAYAEGATLDLTNFDLTDTTSLSRMFFDTTLSEIKGMGTWDTSNITDVNNMFNGASNLTNVDGIENWNVQNVTNMDSMFRNCTGLTKLNFDGWNTSSLTSMAHMFSGASNLTNIDGIKDWNVSSVTTMESTFRDCSSLTELDLSNWVTTDALTTTNTMFYGLSLIETLDLSGFNMTNVTQAPWMFQNCHALREIKGIETWTLENVVRTASMFYNCYSLNTIDLSSLNMPSGVNTTNMFGVALDENLTDDQKKILVITNDETIKNYDFATSNRLPSYTLTLDASDATDFGGSELVKTVDKYYVTTFEFNNPEQGVQDIIDSFGTPTRDLYDFVGWELVGTQATGLDQFNATYKATWELRTPNDDNVGDDDQTGEGGNGDATPQPPVGDDDQTGEGGNGDATPQPPVGDDDQTGEGENDGESSQPPVSGGGAGQPPVENVPTNGIENLEELDKELQEKVDSLIAEVETVEGNLSLNIKGDSEDIAHVKAVEVTKDGIFAVVDGQKLKFGVALDGLELDPANGRAVRVNESNKYAAIPHENTNGGLKINSKNLENILITSKVAEPFTDVADADWFKEDVEEAFNYVFTTGTTATTYSPYNQITRAQFAVMIARALELKPVSSTSELKDLNGKWYQNEAQALYEAGIIKGFNDGTFGGEKQLTRQQAAIMLGRMLERTGVNIKVENDVKFADMDKIADNAQDAVKYLALNGVLVSGESTNFNPYNNLTRAQMAKMLVRSLKLSDWY